MCRGSACLPGISIADYRNYATLRVDALNHALRGIPKEKVRLHVCWGSFHGPHHDDIPLRDIIDLIFRVNAGSYSIEASNPCHEHEWRVFEEVKLPQGATLIPGVVIAVLMLFVILARIESEERLLSETFGAEYDVYRARTWRLIPYLY